MNNRDPNAQFSFDIECYPNFFSCVIMHRPTRTRWVFEVSDRINQSAAFIKFLIWVQNMHGRMWGFNNVGYDYVVIHHVWAVFEAQGYFTAADAYEKSCEIFATQDRFGVTIWPRDRRVAQVDLFLIHHFNNFAKATSLKLLEINLRSKRVTDLPIAPGTWLTPDQMDVVIPYNCDDVDWTENFATVSERQVAFRDDLIERMPELGDVVNFNDTKIGKEVFIKQLNQSGIATHKKVNGRKTPIQSLRPTINLGDVISPKVFFNRPEFQALLGRLRSSTIVETKGVFDDMKAVIDGFTFDFGLGGIHGSQHTVSVYPDDEYDLVDVDVASYYPNLAIANRFYPEHFDEAFCNIYLDVFNMRKQYGKKTAENAMLKLALNGVYGDSGNAYSPFFDTKYMMSITINGQLMLCMLSEMVMGFGCKMVQVNTDGITCLVPKRLRALFSHACAIWERHTGLELEHVDYDAMHIRDVNSYMAVKTDGSVKRIGAYAYVRQLEDPFTREIVWHKNHSQLVVAKAAEAFMVHGVDIAEYIMAHKDPFDFMITIKAPRSHRLEEHRDDGSVNVIQNTSRYYVSTAGCALVKVMPPLAKKPGVERPQSVQAGWRVKTCNDMASFDWSDVNWLYYIEEAKKLCSWRL